MVSQQPQMRIRLPPDVRGWVEESAERNYRSINAEIVFWLNAARSKVLEPGNRSPGDGGTLGGIAPADRF